MPNRSPERVLSSKTVFKGKIFQVTVDQIVEPGGVAAERDVVHHNGSVVVLPHLANENILLVRQFRYPARECLWELVAGGIDPGETPLHAAARELLEETGYRARTFRPILKFYSSPGFLTEQMHLIEAFDLAPGKAQREPDERIQVRAFKVAKLKEMVRAKRIKDGKTLVALLWLFQNEPRRRK
jgi:ADP-ribose pyrophosphatase